MSESIGAIFILAFCVLLFAIAPCLGIWGLNTISDEAHFGWHIPHGFWTYLGYWAVMVTLGKPTKSK